MTAYEKGIIWGNDNYRTIGALVNIALATGNIGREGGGVCRLGGHQEGYMRPSDAHVGRPAPYIDQLLIAGKGKVHHIWANDHYKTTLNASIFKREYKRRTNMVKEAMDARAGATREELVEAIVGAIEAGGLFSVERRHHPQPDRPGGSCDPAGGRVGRDEPHLHERRAPHAPCREIHGSARDQRSPTA